MKSIYSFLNLINDIQFYIDELRDYSTTNDFAFFTKNRNPCSELNDLKAEDDLESIERDVVGIDVSKLGGELEACCHGNATMINAVSLLVSERLKSPTLDVVVSPSEWESIESYVYNRGDFPDVFLLRIHHIVARVNLVRAELIQALDKLGKVSSVHDGIS